MHPPDMEKTTFVLAYFNIQKKQNIACYWYRLEPEDAFLGIFYSHLAQLLFDDKQCAEIKKYIASSNNIGEDAAFINAMFCQELSSDSVQKKVLFFDDFHHVNATPTIKENIRYFCDNLPPNFSIILSSRTKSGLLAGKSVF